MKPPSFFMGPLLAFQYLWRFLRGHQSLKPAAMGEPSAGRPQGIERQMDIYKKGLRGIKPGQPVAIDKLEEMAKEKLSREAFDYLAGGAGAEDALRANREAFRRWRLVPRLLRDVADRDLSVEVLGRRLPVPFLLAPIGVQSILHPEAERAVARAARTLATPMILSTVSSTPMEVVAELLGDVPHWFQLYWPRHRELTASFLKRAEQAGYSAIVVTLDTYLLSWRERDLQNAYLPFLQGKGLANYFSDPVFRAALKEPPEKDPLAAVQYWGTLYADPALTWKDLAFLREHTRLPIVLKGILDPDDARQALDHGMDGIVVSNHGGRQLDGAVAALDALPRVVEAVAGRTTILFDSGIRRGADLLKAVALGARAVLLGRPYCYGLAINGEQGVRDVLLNFSADLDLSLGLCGARSLADMDRSRVVP